MITISNSNSKSSHLDKKFSTFGKYIAKDKTVLELPDNTLTFERLSKDKFSYKRVSKNETVTKLIAIRTENLEIELVPTFPLFVPSYKSDFVFLRFSNHVFVSKDSSTEIFLEVPVEIALFFTGSEIREPIDVFVIDPTKSRYALYGQPEHGKLCKYAALPPQPKEISGAQYESGRLRLLIKNELETGVSLGMLVFPITDHEIYYSGANAVFDDLTVTIKERLGVEIADVVQKAKTGPSGWARSPRNMKPTDYKFSMEMGIA